MKVIVDNKIPFIKEAIGKIADEVIYVPGKDFTPAEENPDAYHGVSPFDPETGEPLKQPRITTRKPGTIHCYSHNRLRSYRYRVLPRSGHNLD